MKDISGSVAIVTGASGGIGLATAQLLTEKGAKVALVARSKERLLALSRKLPESLVVPTDMAKETDIVSMVQQVKEKYGRIDILVNNAGRGYDALVEHIDPVTFREVFELDIMGPLIAMQQVVPLMRSQKQGSIVNISSGTALMYLPEMAAYSSLKRALVGISLTAREELKQDGISVSVVYPYITDTDFEKHTIKHHNPVEENNDEGVSPSNLPKADSAEYVAEKILEAIMSGKAEIFAHEWMKERRR